MLWKRCVNLYCDVFEFERLKFAMHGQLVVFDTYVALHFDLVNVRCSGCKMLGILSATFGQLGFEVLFFNTQLVDCEICNLAFGILYSISL